MSLKATARNALMVLMLPAIAVAQKGSDSPQFRGPAGLGVSADKGVPTAFGPNQNIAWKVDLVGSGTSAPCIAGDRIYMTGFSGFNEPGQRGGSMDSLKLHVFALNRADGKQIWAKEIAPKLPERQSIRENHGYASSTPATDGERLYVFLGKTGVFAFDLSGKELWRADVGSTLHEWGSANSPVIHGELVLINASVESNSLVALNRKTGKEVWRAPGIRESWNTPIIANAPGGKKEIVLAIFGKVLGFDPTDGKQLWSCNTDIGWYMVPSIVSEGETVYCVGGRGGGAGALAVKTGGRGDVTKSHRLWKVNKGTNVPSPVLHEGHLFWAKDDTGVLTCAEAKTGKIVWEEELERSNGVYSSIALADGKLYVIGRAGKVFVVEAKPVYKQVAVSQPLERATYNSTPALAGGKMYLRVERHLYCIGNK